MTLIIDTSHQITIAKRTVVKQGLILPYDDFHLSGLKGTTDLLVFSSQMFLMTYDQE
jgi:hypothetical protein